MNPSSLSESAWSITPFITTQRSPRAYPAESPSAAPVSKRETAPGRLPRVFPGLLRSRKRTAHIIGVSVIDTTPENATATLSVTANSRNRRPTMPSMSRMGMNTASSDTVIDKMVKPICRAPTSAACSGFIPFSM